MKKGSAILLFIFSLQTVFAQTWCAPGAKWTYGYSDAGGYTGYVEVVFSGDTIINSINCKRLLKTKYVKSYFSSTIEMYNLGSEITYEQDSIVYIRVNNNNYFDTLYNFKASIGDHWTMIRRPSQCDSTSNITVIDTGTISINSSPLKFIVVNLHFDSNFPNIDYQDTIIEKIGIIGSYFLPADFCSAALDGHEGGGFRCYNDDNFNIYKPHYTKECDFITEINEIEKEESINIYPNPASDLITITANNLFGKIKSIEWYNSFGQLILVTKQTNPIDIKELPNGLYFLKVRNNEGRTGITKFLKE